MRLGRQRSTILDGEADLSFAIATWGLGVHSEGGWLEVRQRRAADLIGELEISRLTVAPHASGNAHVDAPSIRFVHRDLDRSQVLHRGERVRLEDRGGEHVLLPGKER